MTLILSYFFQESVALFLSISVKLSVICGTNARIVWQVADVPLWTAGYDGPNVIINRRNEVWLEILS